MVEVWYCWRVVIDYDDEGPRLIVPRSDPHIYETPVHHLFDTAEEARAWFDEELDSWQEPDEHEYMRTWVLCKETLEVVQ